VIDPGNADAPSTSSATFLMGFTILIVRRRSLILCKGQGKSCGSRPRKRDPVHPRLRPDARIVLAIRWSRLLGTHSSLQKTKGEAPGTRLLSCSSGREKGWNGGPAVGFCGLPPLPFAAVHRGERQGWGTQFVCICRKKQKRVRHPPVVGFCGRD
jgi:hypothetical protein